MVISEVQDLLCFEPVYTSVDSRVERGRKEGPHIIDTRLNGFPERGTFVHPCIHKNLHNRFGTIRILFVEKSFDRGKLRRPAPTLVVDDADGIAHLVNTVDESFQLDLALIRQREEASI